MVPIPMSGVCECVVISLADSTEFPQFSQLARMVQRGIRESGNSSLGTRRTDSRRSSSTEQGRGSLQAAFNSNRTTPLPRRQRLPKSRVRSSRANPRAAMPLARIARLLAAQGNIRISKSGMNLFGQSSAASPKARPSWTPAYNPKVFMAGIPVRDFYPLKREEGMDGQLRRLRRSDHRASRRDRTDKLSPASS